MNTYSKVAIPVATKMRKIVKSALVLLLAASIAGSLVMIPGGRSAVAGTQKNENISSFASPPSTDRLKNADSSYLKTWWHTNGVRNSSGAIDDNQVRESPFYSVSVTDPYKSEKQYRSFTYLSIPRNGKGKQGYSKTDGAEFASEATMTMSWTSFEYTQDTWVRVSLDTGQTIKSADEVTIRPTTLKFEKKLIDNHTVAIKVPASPEGYRFSVEFAPQVTTVYASSSSGLTTQSRGTMKVESEPHNAMMVFAQPMVSHDASLIPEKKSGSGRSTVSENTGTILYLKEGKIPNLDNTKAQILYFKPGTYWMGSRYRALLPSHVKWIYLAPGAFVKGAFRFLGGNQKNYKVTGYGVLSGEQYVYEADTEGNYDHLAEGKDNCHSSCVKMLQFESTKKQQKLTLQGVTIKEPPYHSFVVYGDENSFSMNVSNYQQIGSWYWQTDGLELYRGSRMRHTFFHANDDVLKLYHSDVSVKDTVIWKNENGPVVQWGWTPRNIDRISVDQTNIIHNRMYFNSIGCNTCIFNSSSSWQDMNATNTADPGTTIKNLTFTNTRVEGMTNCAIRIYALSNMQNVVIKNFHVDDWNEQPYTLQQNQLKLYTNQAGQAVTLGDSARAIKGLILHNYTVGNETIRKAGDNWAIAEPGRINFDKNTWDMWDAVASKEPAGPAPQLTVNGLTDGTIVSSRLIHVSGATTAARVVADVNGQKTTLPLSSGKFEGTITLPDIDNRVRITAYGAKGSTISAKSPSTSERYQITAFGNLVGSLTDPQGDDDGDGNYLYPTDGAFNKGSFDMTGVRVYSDGDTIRLVATMAGDVRNPWSANHMSTQRLNYYLSDPGNASGISAGVGASAVPLLPGTNTNSRGPWRYAIVIDGRNAASKYGPGVYDKNGTRLGPINLTVVGGRQIVASFDASLLAGFDYAKAGYQVSMFSSSEDGEGVGNVRPVYSADCYHGIGCDAGTGQYKFGGGRGRTMSSSPFDTDLTDSNAIDVITGTADQHALMKPVAGGPILPFVYLTRPDKE